MFIEKAELFEGMRQGFMEEVTAVLEEKRCEEGEFLFRRGEAARFLYILEEGRVRLTVGERGTVSSTVRTPGDVFGWSSLIGPAAYTASAQCLTPAIVMRVPGSRMNELLSEHPEDGLVFYRRLAGLIRRRLIDSYRSLPTYDSEKRPHSYG